jgi:hypothetical protein
MNADDGGWPSLTHLHASLDLKWSWECPLISFLLITSLVMRPLLIAMWWVRLGHMSGIGPEILVH